MLVTVIDRSKELNLPKGTIVSFEKIPNSIDEKAIDCFHDGKKIGTIGQNGRVIAKGTETNTKIYADVPEKFTGIVKEVVEITTGRSRTGLVVEIATTGSEINKSDEIITLRFKGGEKRYPAKTKVLSDSMDGKVFVCITIKDDTIVSVYNEELAGALDEAAKTVTPEQIKVIREVIEAKGDLEAKVSKTERGGYYADVVISSAMVTEVKTAVAKKGLALLKVDLVKKGFDEEELNAIEDYLMANKFDGSMIENIFKTYKIYPEEVRHRIPNRFITKFEDEFSGLLKGYANILFNQHILCKGDKGSGKNTFVETMAWVYQRPLYSISVNMETDKMDMIGTKTIDTEVESGVAVNTVIFSPEVLLEAMEVGGIINIDEINFAEPGITGLLHSIADDRREIQVPGYKLVKSDDNFLVIATMNEGYEGTHELNEALSDRFTHLKFPQRNSIFSILEKRCKDAKKADIEKCDKVYRKMVNIISDREGNLDESCITIRGFIQALNMATVIGLKEGLMVGVADKISDIEYHNCVKEIISAIV